MEVKWSQVADRKNRVRWIAEVFNVLRLDVIPETDASNRTYTATVCNTSIDVLYHSANHATVEEAQREALDMARLVVKHMSMLLK